VAQSLHELLAFGRVVYLLENVIDLAAPDLLGRVLN
jgi:hypothetical protein